MLTLLILIVIQVQRAEAAKGVPGSPEFGVGVALQLDGPMREDAVALLGDLHPDWLYLPLSWAAVQPAAESEPDLAVLDQVMAEAARSQIAVIISIMQAPAWAQAGDGPNPQLTAQFSALLVQRYPQAVQALELFPRANTLIGWGSIPNPGAYLALFSAVQDRLKADDSTVLLIAAGLQPLGKDAGQIDPTVEMDDLAFLQGLYDRGGRDLLQVVSLQYAGTSTDLMASPYGAEKKIFRHYEMVREMMLSNQHSAGLIWITGFNLAAGANGQNFEVSSAGSQQYKLLQQAYYQVHAQLYVGAAVLQSLNPGPDTGAERMISMLQPDGSLHDFYNQLKQLTFDNNSGAGSNRPGSAKMGNLLKKRP